MTYEEFKTLAKKKAPSGFSIGVKVSNELNYDSYTDDFYTVCYYLPNSKNVYSGESTDPAEAIDYAIADFMAGNITSPNLF